MRLASCARGLRVTVLSILLPALAATAVPADEHVRPAGRFDSMIRHFERGPLVVESLGVDRMESSDPLKSGWESFSSRHGGAWRVHVDERTGMPTLVSGRGIAWFEEDSFEAVSLEQIEAQARAFLADHHTLLGNEGMELDREASTKARGGHWQLVFRQVVDGVRVENARLSMYLKRGRLVMFGASHWGTPTTSGIPSMDADKARAELDAYLGFSSAGYEQVAEPRLTLLAIDADTPPGSPRAWAGKRGEGLEHALIWRFRFREAGAPASWVGEVDAHDGSVHAFYDGTDYGAVKGGVFPASSDGDCASGGCEIAGFPMPFADYTEEGYWETFADVYGNMTCNVSSAPATTNLNGDYVYIADSCGLRLETAPCDIGVDLGMKAGENCAVMPGSSPGNTSAARTTYFHINRIKEIARFYDPFSGWLSSKLTVNVNINSSCNANWDFSQINMYGAGQNCSNTGENPSILVHEFGHGWDQNDGGGRDRPGEAYSDITAVIFARDSCMGRGMYNDGSTCGFHGDPCQVCTGFREFDWELRSEPHQPSTPSNWGFVNCEPSSGIQAGPCNRQPHCESHISTEAMYDLATRDLPAAGMNQTDAWQLVERLWFGTRPGSGGDGYFCSTEQSDSCGADTWYQRMRVADDDDGNLANGTPHAAALFAAFDRHDIACGSAQDAENQSTSSCPTLAAPVLSVNETGPGTQLSWSAVPGAAEYRVFRGEIGCERQQVPIASLPGGQTGYLDTIADQELARDYRVQAFGTNPACHSPVSACEVTSLSAHLQKAAHRVEDYDGDGVPEPGETVQVPVTLYNPGGLTALSVAGSVKLNSPGQGRLLEPLAVWADIPAREVRDSDTPHFEVALQESASCGDVLVLEMDAAATNTNPVSTVIEIPMGHPDRDFEGPNVSIPPETSTPVTSTTEIDQDQTVAAFEASIDIYHLDPTQLIIELTSPDGTTVRLHDRSSGNVGNGIEKRYGAATPPDGPGSMDDFAGEAAQGIWTLSIQDVDASGPTGNGSLTDWTLHANVEGGFDCHPVTCAEPTPTEAPDLVVDTDGSDLLLSWTPVAGVQHHHVLQSAAPQFDDTVDFLARTTVETTHTVSDGVATTPDLTFFQVRATNECNQEGP